MNAVPLVKRFMQNLLKAILSLHLLMTGVAMAESTANVASSGSAIFTTGKNTYLGSFSSQNRLISVEIEGLTYTGSYASNAEDSAEPSSGAVIAKWGRAFLFASSAKTLQCKLDAGFPDASGQCVDADGRRYLMKASAL